MFEKLTTDKELSDLLRKSREKVSSMSGADRDEMFEAQAKSFARSLQPCEHGVVDFEQCQDCRRAALEAKDAG